jgi:5-methyltetrahydrofolate--homocysteine methyltransferase
MAVLPVRRVVPQLPPVAARRQRGIGVSAPVAGKSVSATASLPFGPRRIRWSGTGVPAVESPMAEDDDEIILSELPDDELVPQMHDDLYDGLKDEVVEGVNILLERGWTPYDVLTKALVEGMRIVGIDFRDGILFVPEVLLAANAMKAGMAILKPLLIETGAPRLGKMVIGTVKGDIHDIGKNLVSMMMEGAGFEIVDLGINNPADSYIEALEREDADILGMSALLTTTMPYMKVVIDTLKDRGLRDQFIIMVGGAPLNEEFSKAIGADAYCRDAAVAVETAKEFMARKHNQLARA